jgi:hypothetical protein
MVQRLEELHLIDANDKVVNPPNPDELLEARLEAHCFSQHQRTGCCSIGRGTA